MFDWLKPKSKQPPAANPTPQKPSREELIRQAQANARQARETLGEETIAKLAQAMQRKQQQDMTNPSAQARKILEQMDKGHVADFLRGMNKEPPTKH